MVSVDETINSIVTDERMYTIFLKPSKDNPTFWESCNTLWLRDGDAVLSEDNDTYIVRGFTGINGMFRLEPVPIPGAPAFPGGNIRMAENNRLTFLKGKPLDVNNEWLNKAMEGDAAAPDTPILTTDALPLIWLLTTYVEDYGDRNSNKLNGKNIVLYFLENADNLEWDNFDHYNDPISRMRNLAQRFKEIVDSESEFTRNSFVSRPCERFGRTEVNGNSKLIIDALLSGYEVSLDLDIIGCINC